MRKMKKVQGLNFIKVLPIVLLLSACSSGGVLSALGGNAVAEIAGEVPSALNEIQEIVDEVTPDGPNQRVRVGDNSNVTTSLRPVTRNRGTVVDQNSGNVSDTGNQVEQVDGDFNQNVFEGVPWYFWVGAFAMFLFAWELPRSSELYAMWRNRKKP